jgi:predicted metal-binding protein
MAIPILNYFSNEDIALHSELRNLKSSQAACLNFLFPFHEDLNLAKLVFIPFLSELETITGIEFEYTGPPAITDWFGEPLKGKRGLNRTSIDAAIFWLDAGNQRHASLIEWKYCERNFGICSAHDSGNKEQKSRCKEINSNGSDPSRLCLLTEEREGRSRRYWEHLKTAGISLEAFNTISGCPFQGPFYQLMRQCEVAAYLKEQRIVDFAEVVSISFAGNNALLEVPNELKPLISSTGGDIIAIWNRALQEVPPVRHLTVEDLMENIDHTPGINPEWRSYIRNRYGE